MTAVQDANEGQWAKWRSVADLYHAFFTGLILTVVARRGTADAAEFVFRVFRRQQQERFLPGLEKLGLAHLPPAVAAAQYHYLSNWIGGVHVEYMYETDAKAWVRYPPPRWIWRGTAICGVPGEVSRAMLRGWHANNGVALGDLRLGFVCTKQSVDGQDGLEGYYHQYDHPLELDQRLVFARHLEAPLFDPAAAPALPVASWPKPRLEKAYRNYAMEYVKTAAPVMVQVFGPEDAAYLLHLTGKLIGMQYFDEIAREPWRRPRRGEGVRGVPARCCSKRRTISPRSARAAVRSRSGSRPGSSWPMSATITRLAPASFPACLKVSPPAAAAISPCI